jgi:IS30 family transposase
VLSVVSSWVKRMLPGVQQQMWQSYRLTGDLRAAADAIGVDRMTVRNWIVQQGGLRPRWAVRAAPAAPAAAAASAVRGAAGRLSYEERVRIEVGLEHGESVRALARRLDRAPSTISREVARHRLRRGGYSASHAHRRAFEAAARPQPLKLGADPVGAAAVELRARVVAELAAGRSPRQVSERLKVETPPDAGQAGRVAPETIYRALFLQARGGLRREVEAVLAARREAGQTATPSRVLRSGRTIRKPRTARRGSGQGQIPDMVRIRDRPATTDEDGHWLPGHHEGDLILGKNCQSAIGTIVERATGYVWLLHLPDGHTAEHVRAAIAAQLPDWPEALKQSLTWDRGKEMSRHKQISIDTGIQIYFADPHTPWQRPGSENVNGLLRQYFPKGTDLSVHSAAELQRVANQLNDRPRARLGYAKPIELMTELVLQ